MGPLGWQEIIAIFFIALLVFGPRKLPEIGKSLGKGMRQFKKASDDLKASWEEHIREAEEPVRDLKQTFQDVKTDVEASTKFGEDDSSTSAKPAEEPATPAPITEQSAAPAPEETKPDGHAH
jgi:sec-independent protein translocase protein TatA